MKKQFVSDLISGKTTIVDDVFAVRMKKPPFDYKGKKGSWFELRVADKTGEISTKFWGSENSEATKSLYNSIPTDSIIHVKGVLEHYDGTPQVSVNNDTGFIRVCTGHEYKNTDFIAVSEKNIEEMFESLKKTIDTVNDKQLKNLLDSFFNDVDFADKFKKSPAAMTYHQNWIGGLLEHVLNVIKICETVAVLHPDMNRDLLITGAMLHDVGKMREFELSSTIKITKEGQLLGHVVLGYETVKNKIETLDLDEVLKNKILHMIVSHQGKLEFASPKEPMIPEAVALYYADECDAKTAYMIARKKDANTESAWIWDKRLNRSIYLE